MTKMLEEGREHATERLVEEAEAKASESALRGSYNRAMPEPATEPTYTLYRRGMELLEDGDYVHATEPLAEAARREPEKTSVREALGRAYYRAGRFRLAAREFGAVVETHPVDDYAHFCLGRALSMTGDTRAARHHLALASNLRPDRRDYRYYRRLLDT
jgi:Flp pilus assembly protein TadD